MLDHVYVVGSVGSFALPALEINGWLTIDYNQRNKTLPGAIEGRL